MRYKDDKRFIPGKNMIARIFDEDNQLVEEKEFPILRHFFLLHDFLIPEAGKPSMEVNIPD